MSAGRDLCAEGEVVRPTWGGVVDSGHERWSVSVASDRETPTLGRLRRLLCEAAPEAPVLCGQGALPRRPTRAGVRVLPRPR